MRSPRIRFIVVLAAVLAALPALPARAQDVTCTATNTTINFGAYDVLAGSTLPGTGAFTVTCTNTNVRTLTVNYAVALAVSPVRQMAPPLPGTDRVSYELYLDSADTVTWGNTAGHMFTGSLRVRRNRSASSAPVSYYGLITPGGQDVSAASYTQTLSVTVTCTPSPPC